MLYLGKTLHAAAPIFRINGIARFDLRQMAVAHRALDGTISLAHELVQGVNRFLAGVSCGPRRCQRAAANGHAHSARAGEARGCGAGGLQETASSESARGMGCFGHLSSFEFPGIEPWDATRTCGECMRREWIATMSPRQCVSSTAQVAIPSSGNP